MIFTIYLVWGKHIRLHRLGRTITKNHHIHNFLGAVVTDTVIVYADTIILISTLNCPGLEIYTFGSWVFQKLYGGWDLLKTIVANGF